MKRESVILNGRISRPYVKTDGDLFDYSAMVTVVPPYGLRGMIVLPRDAIKPCGEPCLVCVQAGRQ